MDRCPHCGKALRPEAESCPHCGSDFETGWNPDADYYGLELPGEEETFPVADETPRRIPWDTIIGIGVVGLAGLCFLLVIPSRLEPRTTLVMVTLLLLSLWFFLVKTRGERQTQKK